MPSVRVLNPITMEYETREFVAAVAAVREAIEDDCRPAPLPRAQLLVRRSWKDHVVRFVTWPRYAWRNRKGREEERRRLLERNTIEVTMRVVGGVAKMLQDREPKS